MYLVEYFKIYCAKAKSIVFPLVSIKPWENEILFIILQKYKILQLKFSKISVLETIKIAEEKDLSKWRAVLYLWLEISV